MELKDYTTEELKAELDSRIKVSFTEEKQGEQKPQGKPALEVIKEKADNANKVKPKFKVGDWITNYQYNKLIIGINSDYPFYIFEDGITKRIKDIDEKYRLWDITKDAKDSDILANDHHILILKELYYNWGDDGTPSAVKAYCGIKPNGNFEIGTDNYCFCGTLHIHPATKEQRDMLFSKIKEAGYEWDVKNKRLIKRWGIWNK